MRATRLAFSALALAALCTTAPSGQAQPPSQNPPSAVGLVKKNRAPVSNDTLKVTLPKPQEIDLPRRRAMGQDFRGIGRRQVRQDDCRRLGRLGGQGPGEHVARHVV